MANKKLLYYILSISIVSTLAIIYFISLPLINTINDTKNNTETKKEELFSLKQRERKLINLSASYSEYKSKIDTLNSLFPSQKDISQYMTEIENASNDSGVRIKSLKVVSQVQLDKKAVGQYTQLTKTSDLYEFPLEVTVDSDSFDGIINFTKTMESLSRFTTITKINLKSDTTGVLEAVISFKVYVL